MGAGKKPWEVKLNPLGVCMVEAGVGKASGKAKGWVVKILPPNRSSLLLLTNPLLFPAKSCFQLDQSPHLRQATQC